jgi:hypothetical protein
MASEGLGAGVNFLDSGPHVSLDDSDDGMCHLFHHSDFFLFLKISLSTGSGRRFFGFLKIRARSLSHAHALHTHWQAMQQRPQGLRAQRLPTGHPCSPGPRNSILASTTSTRVGLQYPPPCNPSLYPAGGQGRAWGAGGGGKAHGKAHVWLWLLSIEPWRLN